MAEIIAAKPGNNWTPEKLALAMRENETVSAIQPKYTSMTARRDWHSLSNELAHNRKELIDIYLNQQLEIVDGLLEDVITEWEELRNTPVDEESEMPLLVQMATKARSLNALGQAIERLLGRQAALIPIEVPKKLQIEERRINIDLFLEARNRQENKLRTKLGDGVIDGQYEEAA